MPQQIELQNLSLQAGHPLVHGVSLTLRRKRVLALVGSSGSGKSLTCAAALGILPPGVRQTSGAVLVDGRPAAPCDLRGSVVATIMQNPRSAFNPCTPWEPMREKPAGRWANPLTTRRSSQRWTPLGWSTRRARCGFIRSR